MIIICRDGKRDSLHTRIGTHPQAENQQTLSPSKQPAGRTPQFHAVDSQDSTFAGPTVSYCKNVVTWKSCELHIRLFVGESISIGFRKIVLFVDSHLLFRCISENVWPWNPSVFYLHSAIQLVESSTSQPTFPLQHPTCSLCFSLVPFKKGIR